MFRWAPRRSFGLSPRGAGSSRVAISPRAYQPMFRPVGMCVDMSPDTGARSCCGIEERFFSPWACVLTCHCMMSEVGSGRSVNGFIKRCEKRSPSTAEPTCEPVRGTRLRNHINHINVPEVKEKPGVQGKICGRSQRHRPDDRPGFPLGRRKSPARHGLNCQDIMWMIGRDPERGRGGAAIPLKRV